MFQKIRNKQKMFEKAEKIFPSCLSVLLLARNEIY